ncbi:hypothetical protein KIN20_024372 [Parelaphostrongylus tenuis]|uniref:Uncharacterized protein n=1 Tax=Parelaphostrongylus tenuis TaxID=148309 RepID=A0AAD5MY72_PARTN|nr:hypothetical protein KIN20_024372 [Parelaphostrongylus tenuis]
MSIFQLLLTCPADEVRVKVEDDFDADSLAVGQQVGVGEVDEAEVGESLPVIGPTFTPFTQRPLTPIAQSPSTIL